MYTWKERQSGLFQVLARVCSACQISRSFIRCQSDPISYPESSGFLVSGATPTQNYTVPDVSASLSTERLANFCLSPDPFQLERERLKLRSPMTMFTVFTHTVCDHISCHMFPMQGYFILWNNTEGLSMAKLREKLTLPLDAMCIEIVIQS